MIKCRCDVCVHGRCHHFCRVWRTNTHSLDTGELQFVLSAGVPHPATPSSRSANTPAETGPWATTRSSPEPRSSRRRSPSSCPGGDPCSSASCSSWCAESGGTSCSGSWGTPTNRAKRTSRNPEKLVCTNRHFSRTQQFLIVEFFNFCLLTWMDWTVTQH